MTVTGFCDTCRYRGGEGGTMTCHRYPPQVIHSGGAFGNPYGETVYPKVQRHDWCAEYEEGPVGPPYRLRSQTHSKEVGR